MRFHEHTGHTRGYSCTRQHRHKLALAARGTALPARQLHRMRGIEYHRATRGTQHRQRTHIGHQIVIAKGKAALADHDVGIARGTGLIDHVLHFPRREELTLLDVHGLAAGGHRHDEVGLPAQKRRRLQHIDYSGHFVNGRVFMHIGQHRHTKGVAHMLEYLQALGQTGAAETFN